MAASSGESAAVKSADRALDALAEQVAESVQLARLDGIENVYIAISESPHPLSVTAPSNRCGADWPERPLERLLATARMVRTRMDVDPNPVFGAA